MALIESKESKIEEEKEKIKREKEQLKKEKEEINRNNNKENEDLKAKIKGLEEKIKQLEMDKKKQNSKERLITNNNENKEKPPISLYKVPTLIGLNNIGSTCFLNATLQCLSQTEPLTNYFLSKNHENEIINNNIAKINKRQL